MLKPLLKRISLALCIIGFISVAHAVDLKPGHPVEYVVKDGDTLWDLSQTFLDDAWLWPEIGRSMSKLKIPTLYTLATP